MASVTKYPSSGADDSAVGTRTWSNPTNIYLADGTDVASVIGAAEATVYSHYLKATDFKFAIPDGATIDGIIVEYNEKASTNSASKYVADTALKLVVDNTVVGDNKATTSTKWGLSYSWVSYGGATDKWGLTPTVAEINASNFGVVLEVKLATTFSGPIAYVDAVRITVYYTEAAGGISIPVVQYYYNRLRRN